MHDKKILGLITARGGSKRLPGKNVKELGGVPLISWTIRAAKKVPYISRLILSSDDPQAIKIAQDEECEAPFIRPQELAGDYATSYDVAEHALKTMGLEEYEWLLLLQPTSPFRTAQDINSAIELAIEKDVDSLLSVCESDKSHLMLFDRKPNGTLQSFYDLNIKDLNNSRSQDLPKSFEINGAIYIVKISWFLRNKVFFDENSVTLVMSKKNSVNIDTQDDWLLAESYLNHFESNKVT